MIRTLLIFIALALPVGASAATFSFSPASISTAPGKNFSVSVYVVPAAGEEITTAKFDAAFEPGVVSVTSFTPASGWMALTQPGYDAINNTTGVVTKTGGYPSKVTTSTLFGTLVFTAVADGNSLLATSANSLLLDATNTDRYVKSGSISIAVATPVAPVVTPVETPTTAIVNTSVDTVVVAATPTTTSTDEATTNATTSEETVDDSQLAAVGVANSGMWTYILALLGLIVALFGGWFAWKRWM